MNNRDNQAILKQLRDERQLSYRDIMRLTGRSFSTVKAYFLHPGSACHRHIPDEVLAKLKQSIKG